MSQFGRNYEEQVIVCGDLPSGSDLVDMIEANKLHNYKLVGVETIQSPPHSMAFQTGPVYRYEVRFRRYK